MNRRRKKKAFLFIYFIFLAFTNLGPKYKTQFSVIMENNDDDNKNNKNVLELFVQPSTEPSSLYALFLDKN